MQGKNKFHSSFLCRDVGQSIVSKMLPHDKGRMPDPLAEPLGFVALEQLFLSGPVRVGDKA